MQSPKICISLVFKFKLNAPDLLVPKAKARTSQRLIVIELFLIINYIHFDKHSNNLVINYNVQIKASVISVIKKCNKVQKPNLIYFNTFFNLIIINYKPFSYSYGYTEIKYKLPYNKVGQLISTGSR